MASSWWPSYSKPASSSRSCKYDIFLSFRGEDTRKTFVDHLYTAFKERLISVYKDNETLPRDEYISLSLFEAIEESRIAVIIFSKNYANSSWCLEELVHIMKCKREIGLIVLPVFYDVDPSDVRNQKGDLGKSMSWKKLWNINKAQLWKKSLVDASNIAGWEVKHIANGHESQVIEEIIDTILDRLFPLNLDVDEDLVGMTTRLQDLKSKLNIGYDGVRMVGIWGCGGSGKTTLATFLYMEISHQFHGRCIVENVREESSKFDLKRLQENMLATIFKTEVKKDVKVGSVAEGKRKIKTMLGNRNVLIMLDDVNELDQLKALAGSHNWFGSGSRIIITTRDEHLLTTHKVDVIFPVRLLSHDESIRLFKRHAYNEENPIEDYDTLSLSVISYAAGLPLALKVLGSFLYDKENKGWMSTLARLKDIPEMEIMEKLKISYDGLKTVEKELFLEIVCFFRGWNKDDAMEILEACEFHPEIGIEVLRQKALITIVDGIFDMHALVQEMGYYIKHSRVWKDEAIKNMYFGDATMENDKIEAIYYDDYPSNHDHALHFCKIVSNMRKLRLLMVVMNIDMHSEGPSFLSNELKYIYWYGYPTRSSFPDNFHPTKLVILKLE